MLHATCSGVRTSRVGSLCLGARGSMPQPCGGCEMRILRDRAPQHGPWWATTTEVAPCGPYLVTSAFPALPPLQCGARVHHTLRVKCFHEASAGNVQECSL